MAPAQAASQRMQRMRSTECYPLLINKTSGKVQCRWSTARQSGRPNLLTPRYVVFSHVSLETNIRMQVSRLHSSRRGDAPERNSGANHSPAPPALIWGFEASLVSRIRDASHTTQRNAQQCLFIWDRCDKILDALKGPSRTSALERATIVTDFDM